MYIYWYIIFYICMYNLHLWFSIHLCQSVCWCWELLPWWSSSADRGLHPLTSWTTPSWICRDADKAAASGTVHMCLSGNSYFTDQLMILNATDSYHCLHDVKNYFRMFWTESILNVNVFSRVLCALLLTCRFYSWEECSFAEFTNFSLDSVPV